MSNFYWMTPFLLQDGMKAIPALVSIVIHSHHSVRPWCSLIGGSMLLRVGGVCHLHLWREEKPHRKCQNQFQVLMRVDVSLWLSHRCPSSACWPGLWIQAGLSWAAQRSCWGPCDQVQPPGPSLVHRCLLWGPGGPSPAARSPALTHYSACLIWNRNNQIARLLESINRKENLKTWEDVYLMLI